MAYELRIKKMNNKGFSIPLVVILVIILAITVYSIQIYTSQAARGVNYSVNLKKAEYIALAGLQRSAAFISAQNFKSRFYKSRASFSFGFTNTYSEMYSDGRYCVTIVDIPALIEKFDADFRLAEYQGIFFWASGSYKNASKYILARFIPGSGAHNVFSFKKLIDANDDFEYVDIELN